MFRPIAGLPNGWQVGYQVSPMLHLVYPEMPCFKRPDGRLLDPFEVARSEQGRAVFHHVKRWLDVMDKKPGMGGSPEYRAMDKAKAAMHRTLVEIGAFSRDLLQTDAAPGN